MNKKYTVFTFYRVITALGLFLTSLFISFNELALAVEASRESANVNKSVSPGALLPSSIEYFRLGTESLPVHVYRIDPSIHNFVLYNMSEVNSLQNLNLYGLRDLGQIEGLKLAIPASMYREDYMTSISYMKNYDHVNNGKFSSAYKGVLLFNPKKDDLPKVKVAYRSGNPNFETEIFHYNSAISLMRMISRGKPIEWKKAYSNIVSVGVDDRGQMLIVYSYGHRTVSSLIEEMLNADQLTVKDLLYVEGGSKGGIYVDPNNGLGYQGYLPNILGVL